MTTRIILILFEEFNSLGPSKIYKNDKIDRLLRAISDSNNDAYVLILPKSRIKILFKALKLNPIKILRIICNRKIFEVTLLDIQRHVIVESIKSKKCSMAIGIGSPQIVISSCRIMRIPYGEMQHGLVSEQEVLDQYKDSNKPDFYLAWSNHYARLLESLSIKTYTIRDFFSGDEATESHKSRMQTVVLFALSIDLLDAIDPFESLSQKMKDIIDLSIKEDFIRVIRFHYRSLGRHGNLTMQNYFQNLYPGIQFSDPLLESSFSAISRADIVVTHISAMAIESALQGKTTYIVPDNNSDISGGLHQRIDPSIYALKNVKYIKHLDCIDFKRITPITVDTKKGYNFSEALEIIVNST